MKKGTKIALIAIAALVALVVLVAAFMPRIQRALFFYPAHDIESHEYCLASDVMTHVTVDTGAGELSGWLHRDETREHQPLLILFGGNGQIASYSFMRYDEDCLWDCMGDYAIMLIDYPGYGISEGAPSENAFYAAALSVYDYAAALPFTEGENIAVMGFSIGTGVATYVASLRPVEDLILVAPFYSIPDMLCAHTGIPEKLLAKIAMYSFPSGERMKGYSAHALIVMSTGDEVIPNASTERLISAFPSEPNTVTLKGLSHNEMCFSRETWDAVGAYLTSAAPID